MWTVSGIFCKSVVERQSLLQEEYNLENLVGICPILGNSIQYILQRSKKKSGKNF